MQKHLDVLKQYWGYDAFRPLQADIIQSIANGRDTLGLMPTGGGKSLTFQVPAMSMDGICLVVTPLIALMKDQVDNLKNRNIQAAAIYTGQKKNDILRILENAVFGAYKFLYVSPERLASETFLMKITQMKVCLIAVDESHCISQWGYDFRPSYLRIAEIRQHLPGVPVLALTATATPAVVDDIQDKLGFYEKNVFRKSFLRSNLVYVVRTVENKDENMLKILHAVPGTSVVYVRNRKRTKEVSEFLNSNGISAEYYHAGLKNETKDERQNRWKNDQTRVIVSTNAFGMGIDKPEVRTVIHLDLPDSLEAYFQEAGRAGRDEKKAYAVLLYNNSDATKMKKRIADSFPDKELIRKVYEGLANYYQVGLGSGLDAVFPFEIADFCTRYKLPVLQTYSSLKILQQAGYIEFTDEQDNASRLIFRVNKDELYNFKQNQDQERLIHILLRSYTGLFTDPAYISEDTIAKRLEWDNKKVYNTLVSLAKEGIIQYIPRKKVPFITFTREREMVSRIALGKDAYEDRLERYRSQVNSVVNYASQDLYCRSELLLAYFGEKNCQPCGKCDICLKNKSKQLRPEEFKELEKQIIHLIGSSDKSVNQIIKEMNAPEEKSMQVIRFLIDNNKIYENNQLKLCIKNT